MRRVRSRRQSVPSLEKDREWVCGPNFRQPNLRLYFSDLKLLHALLTPEEAYTTFVLRLPSVATFQVLTAFGGKLIRNPLVSATRNDPATPCVQYNPLSTTTSGKEATSSGGTIVRLLASSGLRRT